MFTWELVAWFRNLKTLTKLMLGFSAVGVIMVAVSIIGLLGLQQLREELRTVYEGSTLSLANVGASSSSLGLYHDAVLNAGRNTRKSDFEEALRPLADFKKDILGPLARWWRSSSEEPSGTCWRGSSREASFTSPRSPSKRPPATCKPEPQCRARTSWVIWPLRSTKCSTELQPSSKRRKSET